MNITCQKYKPGDLVLIPTEKDAIGLIVGRFVTIPRHNETIANSEAFHYGVFACIQGRIGVYYIDHTWFVGVNG